VDVDVERSCCRYCTLMVCMLACISNVHLAIGSNQWGSLLVQVIFDLMDPQMVFETSEARIGQSICLHAAAVVLTPGGKEGAPDGAEGTISALSSTRFNISNDKFYTNKKTHQQQKSNAKKRAIHGVKVMHSLPAIKLQSMKPKLSKWVFFSLAATCYYRVATSIRDAYLTVLSG
jgi:hypothetical protein